MINVGLLKVVNIRVVMTKIIKNMNIFNKTKNKKLFLTFFSLIFVFSFLAASTIMAQGGDTVPTTEQPKCDIKFIPNISIPGSDFLKSEEGVCLGTDSIGFYIVALYRYGAILAGVVAMFMLVFAGWQWLMAAGRADQITKAKDTIVGVFVGLALLFGGYLLMSQISQNSVNFKDIQLAHIEPKLDNHRACERISELLADSPGPLINYQCGDIIGMSPGNDDTELNTLLEQVNGLVQCVSQNCPGDGDCVRSGVYTPCPAALAFSETPDCNCESFSCTGVYERATMHCKAYQNDLIGCTQNKCYSDDFQEACYWYSDVIDEWGTTLDECRSIEGKACAKNDQCDVDLDGDNNSEYCCMDVPGFGFNDKCGPIEGGEYPCGDD